ncbi:ferrous iron transport protein A [Limnobacter humi]|uniref:Ferrous iron transport protein A n=1 Tax=Limnobacter humi TaxID=1778671 RepID=A0ABT1WF34_9BURK|nr:FeoA family protein [Limnobacter humi]MCQ8896115.1 ferrous iron transport protein A [Limnobacter humi]
MLQAVHPTIQQASGLQSLQDIDLNTPKVVVGVHPPQHSPEWAAWLYEIGFIPGETVMVLTRGMPGADPLVVRVGDSTFALRRAEAACIAVADATDGAFKAAA